MEGSTHDYGLYARCFEEPYDLANSDLHVNLKPTCFCSSTAHAQVPHKGAVFTWPQPLGAEPRSITFNISDWFLQREKAKEDIVVPTLDYEWQQKEWSKMIRSSVNDWDTNVETIVQWSPFSNEATSLVSSI